MVPGSCEFCERPIRCRGWCNAHYKRWRRTGDPQGSVKRIKSEFCPAGHRFTKANTKRNRKGYRKCLTCMRYWSRVYARRARAEGRAAQHQLGYFTEYKRQVKSGERIPRSRPKRPTEPAGARITDLLQVEGGWLTAHEVADRLDLKVETTRSTLSRLRRGNRVQSRRLALNDYDHRMEWRYLIEVDA